MVRAHVSNIDEQYVDIFNPLTLNPSELINLCQTSKGFYETCKRRVRDFWENFFDEAPPDFIVPNNKNAWITFITRLRLLYEFPAGIRFNVMTLNDMKDVNFKSKWGSQPIEIAEEHLPSNPLFDQREPLRHAYYVTETLYLANVPRQTDIAQGPFTQELDAYAAKKSEEKKMYSFVLKHMVERTVSDLIDYENDMIGTNGKIEYKLKDTTNNYDFVLWVGLENHEHPQPLLSETDTIEDIFQAHTAVNPIQYVFGSFLPKLQDKFTARRYFIESIDNISWNERRQYEDEEQGYEDPTDTHRWTFTLFETNIEERKVSIVQVLKNAFKEDNQDNPYVKWMLKCLQLKRDGYNSFDEPEEGSERED